MTVSNKVRGCKRSRIPLTGIPYQATSEREREREREREKTKREKKKREKRWEKMQKQKERGGGGDWRSIIPDEGVDRRTFQRVGELLVSP